MKKGLLIGLAVAGLWAVTPRAQNAQSAKTALDRAATTLGAASLRSIQFSGTGSDYQFGQGYDGNSPWPRFGLPRFVITIDYTIPAFLDERTRVQVENPPLGGGFQPLVGELRQVWALNGTYAWDVAGGNAVPAAADRDLRSAVDVRLAQIWMTPQGFVKAAMAGNPTAKTQTVRGAQENRHLVHGAEQGGVRRRARRAGSRRANRNAVRQRGARRHAVRSRLHRVQGLRRRQVPDPHRPARGGLPRARSRDRRRQTEYRHGDRRAGEHQASAGVRAARCQSRADLRRRMEPAPRWQGSRRAGGVSRSSRCCGSP